jgi:transcriptional regulator with GAF, ATPase, and Fis domain
VHPNTTMHSNSDSGTHSDELDVLRARNEKLERDHRIDILVHEISLEFIHATWDEIDETLRNCLSRIGHFAQVDRCCLFRFTDDKEGINKSQEWHADGIAPLEEFQNLPVDGPLQNSLTRVLNNEIVHIPTVQEMPESLSDERKVLEQLGFNSAFFVPVAISENVIGVLGFGSKRSQTEWRDYELRLLNLLAGVIAQTLSRLDLEKYRKRTEIAMMNILDSMNALVYVADFSTCNVLYINRAAANVFGHLIEDRCPHYESCAAKGLRKE